MEKKKVRTGTTTKKNRSKKRKEECFRNICGRVTMRREAGGEDETRYCGWKMFAKYHVDLCTSAAGSVHPLHRVCRLPGHSPRRSLLSMLTALLSSLPPVTVAEDASHTLGLVLHGHKHTHTQSTHMSTCPQACKHTHTHTHSQRTIWLSCCLSSSPAHTAQLSTQSRG